MSIRVAIRHQTSYQFDRRVQVMPHVVRLRPAPHCRTPIHRYSLHVEPGEHFINWQQDPFGNYLARLVFPEKVARLEFDVDIVADMTVVNPFDFFVEESAERYPFEYSDELARHLAPYLERRESGERLRAWLRGVDVEPLGIADFLVEVNRRLQQDIAYSVRMEPGVQTCEETLGRAIGSCRDTGWLLVQVLRHLGIASRFVSGYLVQLSADVEALDGPSGPTADFTDLHAWAEAFVPGAGWIGLDPTSGLFAGEGHIPLACSPDPTGAAPITGATDPCEVTLTYSNTVQRVHEDPRVTAPYTEEAWARIDTLGREVDTRLEAEEVRLTMGGEPTFVSVDDMESPQWNTAALGEDKWRLALSLAHRLMPRFAPRGLLHIGQGKWYPGEPLPRWALTAYWRTDGQRLWHDSSLLVDGSRAEADTDRDPAGASRASEPSNDRAREFGEVLTARLGLSPDALIGGYEDTLYYLWREGRLPPDFDWDDQAGPAAGLADPLERDRLRRVLQGTLGRPVGYALPLEPAGEGWRTAGWKLRRGHMFLIPGDSSMGYRLPLDSLEPEIEPQFERDPFEPRTPLPTREELAQAVGSDGKGGEDSGGENELLRTTLCLEEREGFLHVFLPPLPDLDAAVRLLARVEDAARETGIAVRIEGYPLPVNPRIRHFQITPDPGVIEVNVQPARSWEELKTLGSTLYAEARLSRLATEKFMLDGRHTGTGGGNHVTVGSADPADSPFLRRPDLLASLVSYWQHHPSLSYLFSGAFIGPTSQAPRVDEARDDVLYELEVALERAHAARGAPKPTAPWLVDRLFRNLLVDLTGNTHRAEFCVDKLYSPDSPGGRRGLLELRAFEMPPHAQMSLVQMLLLRALIARFWTSPYRARPVRWGNALHDRFMLRHFVWEDLRQVVGELNDAGFAFELRWFAPFLEFRFPRHGTIFVDQIELELSFAIEPWNVLGEEATGSGMARYVDSSVERLQARVTGFAPERYALLCNGARVPLRPTGVAGEFVGGVRYKAWNPPSSLHPQVGVNAPLVFDIADIPNGRAIGGATYHVAHPGGRNYETFPVNAAEAEARRMARFWPHGHHPGPCEIPDAFDNPDYPFTLDLRLVTGRQWPEQ